MRAFPATPPIRRAAALGGGATPFDPDLANIQSRILDGGTIWTDAISSKYYLKDQSTDNTHLPRQGRCYTFDGVDDYIAIASLVGSETVVSKNGTASLTISAGRIDATAGTLWDLVLSNGSRYYCNEESGTTCYDATSNARNGTLTNITQATFHSASTSVTSNPNNDDGYRLSGSVYIPKRIGSALAADGNALTVTGRAAYHGCAEVPCLTGDGSNVLVDISSVTSTLGSIDEVEFWFYTAGGISVSPITGDELIGSDSLPAIAYLGSLSSYFSDETLTILGSSVYAATFLRDAIPAGWNKVRYLWNGSSYSIFLNDVQKTTFSSDTHAPKFSNPVIKLFAFNNVAGSACSISDLRIRSGSTTTYFPLQDGPGSSNTNRNIAYAKSDGTGGVISNAVVNGTVSTIWANRVPGQVKDWCIDNGGRIGAAGEYIAGLIGSANAADGNAKTLSAGKFGNPFSRLNLNPATAAEYNGRSIPTASAVASDINAAVTPAESAFRRTDTDGDDRFLIYESALTGSDLTNVEAYVA